MRNEPRGELARYAFGFSDRKPGRLFWAIYGGMILYILWCVFSSPAQACHRFHVWKYPWPQRCGNIIAQAAHPVPRLATVEDEERVSVEITVTPELLETWARQDALARIKDELK